jgi:hypothetical protein
MVHLQTISTPSEEPLAWKGCDSSLEWGGLNAKKIEGAEAFGCHERTPSLPYAAKENPRVAKNRPFHAWLITALLTTLPRRVDHREVAE